MAAGRPPPSLSPTGLLVAGWAAAIAASVIFLSLSWKVATYAPLVVLDQKVATWLHQHGTLEITAFMYAVTQLHSVAGTSAMALTFGAVLARMREWYWLLTLALSMGGGLALNVLLKEVYRRVRPYFDDPWVTLSTYSFPSGHTAGAVLFYGVLGAFLVSRFPGWRERVACLAGAALAVGLVAFSRMYLGAHYLSDVAAAACSSLVWLVLCLSSVHALVRRRRGQAPRLPGVRAWRWIGPALALAALGIAALYLPVGEWAHRLELQLDGMDLFEALGVFVAVSIAATLFLAPAWILQVGAGAVFGFGWGLAAAIVSSIGAALAALMVSRHLVRGRLEAWIRKHEQFRRFDQEVSKDGWKVIALLRLTPFVASGIKSYFFGLTRVRVPVYLLASLAGMLPGILLKVYVGAAGRDALKGGPLEWALFAAGILATISLALLVRRLRREK